MIMKLGPLTVGEYWDAVQRLQQAAEVLAVGVRVDGFPVWSKLEPALREIMEITEIEQDRMIKATDGEVVTHTGS